MTGGRFALFTDCLLVGLMALAAAVPVLTAYPAFVAACALLRERVALEESVGVRSYWRRLREVVRSGPAGLLVPPLALALLFVDAVAVAAGVPGGRPLGAVLAVVAVLGATVGLRAAASWRADRRWPELARSATRDAVRDLGGSTLLALAAVTAVAVAVVVPVTVLLLCGPLALAAVAVQGRTEARWA
jgi:hypothetical protein